MAGTFSFLPPVSRKTPLPIILVGSTISLGPRWRDHVSYYTNPLVKRLSEENYPHALSENVLVTYSQIHPALIDPVYPVVGHDEEGTDRTVMDYSTDTAALRGYLSVIEIIEDLETRHPNEFSFFLWHVVAGKHGSWDPRWEIVCGELIRRHVNLSMILLDDCPFFEQLFSAISPDSSRLTPWFRTFPNHRFLLSGFMPPGELNGAVPSLPVMSAAHPSSAPWISAPSTIGGNASPDDFHSLRNPLTNLVMPWNAPSGLSAHETRYSDDQRAAPHFSHPGSDVHAQVQSQPHPNLNHMTVYEAQGFVPLDWPAHPHNSGVEQRQPTPHSYTETIDSRDDSPNPNPNPNSRSILMSSGNEMNANEWTWTLNVNGMCVHVRALMVAAVGDPKLSELPKELRVEFAVQVDPNLSILDIQAWISEYNAWTVRLSHVGETDDCDFDQLVQKIRAHGYAVVTWENRDRLLLAALGKSLLCAAFPEKGTTNRPTPQPPPKLRKQPKKPQSSRKKGKQGPQQRRRPYPSTTSRSSSDGPCDEQYLDSETTAQSPITLQQSQPEQPQMPQDAQIAIESMPGEIGSPNPWHQVEELAPCQMISESLPRFQQQFYPQALGELDALGEQPVHDQWTGTGAAGYMADLSNLKSEAMEFEMFKYVDYDGNGDKYDRAS